MSFRRKNNRDLEQAKEKKEKNGVRAIRPLSQIPSEQRDRYYRHLNSCARKRAYDNSLQAQEVMVRICIKKSEDLDILDFYQCLACGKWHLGRDWSKRADSLADQLEREVS